MKHLQQIEFSWLKIKWEDSFVSDLGYSLDMLQGWVLIGFHLMIHLTWLKDAPLLQQLSISAYTNQWKKWQEKKQQHTILYSLLSDISLSVWELLELKSIYKTLLSSNSLKSIEIYACPKLKLHAICWFQLWLAWVEYYQRRRWWNNLEWDDPSPRHKFQSKFKKFTNELLSEITGPHRCRYVVWALVFGSWF